MIKNDICLGGCKQIKCPYFKKYALTKRTHAPYV